MKRLIASLIVATSLLVARPVFAQDRVATVNVGAVVFGLEEFKALQGQWNVKVREITAEDEKLKTELQTLLSQRDNTTRPGTPEHDKLTLDLLRKRNEGQFNLQIKQSQLGAMQKQQIASLFEKVYAAVGDVAKEKNYTMVVADIRPGLNEQAVNEMNTQQFIGFALSSRTVLYANDNANLSDEVLAKMNADYAAGAPAAPAAPTTPTP